MQIQFIVADSGGSSTTWAFVYEDGLVKEFTTSSLHPKYVLNNPEIVNKLKQEIPLSSAPLYFYGAGCTTAEIQQQMKLLLSEVGLPNSYVFSDALAVCRAIYKSQPGWIGIFGTGSIVVYYDGTQITRRVGGFGSLIGDEGSGFHFGRLLVKQALLQESWSRDLVDVLESREVVLSHLASPEAQSWLGTLAGICPPTAFESLHRENITSFFSIYQNQLTEVKQLGVVGSYAFHQKRFFQEIAAENGVEITCFLVNPIQGLIDYHQLVE